MSLPTEPTLADLRNHVADALRTAAGADWNSVTPHPGRFDAAEIRRTMTDAPCARVAVDSVGSLATAGPGKWAATVGFRVYVFAADGRRPKDELALEFVAATLQRIAASNWGAPAHFRNVLPDSAGALNLFSDETDAAGVALWEISWQQQCLVSL